MLIVKPIFDKDLQKELGDICGVEFNPDALAFSAYESENFIGFCQFTVSGNTAMLTDVRAAPEINDFEAMFIMSRGALNYIDLCGFHIAKTTKKAGDITLIRAIGFKELSEGMFEMNLAEEFTSKCCNCQ